jgi:hypothetical protein
MLGGAGKCLGGRHVEAGTGRLDGPDLNWQELNVNEDHLGLSLQADHALMTRVEVRSHVEERFERDEGRLEIGGLLDGLEECSFGLLQVRDRGTQLLVFLGNGL